MEELEALVILNNINLLGPIKARKLLNQFSSARAALNASSLEISQIPGFGPALLNSFLTWKEQDAWEKDLELIRQQGITLIPHDDPRYPKSLKALPDAPLLLYVKGKLEEHDQPGLAVIGTRNCSIYGREAALEFSTYLAARGWNVISGLARGIDTSAHQGALKTGRTLAVIGSGLSQIYPKENHLLAKAIESLGAVISEFPMNTFPDKHSFPRRNRIVSALSMGLLLVEAPVKSGAMITMDYGREHGKQLFALPGRADMETFRGNHLLIKKGIAKLVESADDILEFFPNVSAKSPLCNEIKSTPHLNPEERLLLSQMPAQDCSIDEITAIAQIPVSRLNGLLVGLIIKKVVKEFPGKIYKKM